MARVKAAKRDGTEGSLDARHRSRRMQIRSVGRERVINPRANSLKIPMRSESQRARGRLPLMGSDYNAERVLGHNTGSNPQREWHPSGHTFCQGVPSGLMGELGKHVRLGGVPGKGPPLIS
jgi:hypothetical protein